MSDEVPLTVPRERPFYRVAHLVLGGLPVRLDLTFETLEDLQVALVGLLERDAGGGEITVAVSVQDGALQTRVGPFDGDALSAALEQGNGGALGLRRVLETVVDQVELTNDDDGEWVSLTKRVETAQAAGS